MDIMLISQLTALAVLLVLSAFFSSSETSLFSLSSAQLQQMRRDRNAELPRIEKLLSEPRRLIATILIGNEFVNVSASVLSATVVINFFGEDKSWLNVLIMVPILLLFGEITPKTLALANNVKFASFQSRYIEWFARSITPLRKAVRAVSEFFLNFIVGDVRSEGNILTEDMVRSLAQAAVGEGSLDRVESQYIYKIFDFGNKTVRDVMTYRSQMVSVNTAMTYSSILNLLHTERRTKVPVFAADTDEIMGVLFARDALNLRVDGTDEDRMEALTGVLRPPYLVPETRMAADLFASMRAKKRSIVLVTDEYGGVIGLVTLEDLLECIFGELPSGSDAVLSKTHRVESAGVRTFRASGALPIQKFSEATQSHLATHGRNTIGGLIIHSFGELPEQGAEVRIENVRFTVTSVDQNRILEVTARVDQTVKGDVAGEVVQGSEQGDAPAAQVDSERDSGPTIGTHPSDEPSAPSPKEPR